MPPASLLRPAELPPFNLIQLVPSVLTPPPPLRPSSPPDPTLSPSVGSRISQFVHLPRGGGGGDAAQGGQKKAVVARSVDGLDDQLWVGTSDGRARSFRVRPKSRSRRDVSPSPSPSRGGGKGKERERGTVQVEAELLDERQVVPGAEGGKQKAVERLMLVPKVSKAIIQSEGVLTFHSLPSLAPLPTAAFPPIRGVSAFAIDEDSIASTSSSTGREVILCAIKRRSIHLFRLREGGCGQIKEVPLSTAAFHGVLRRDALLLADIDNYSIVSLSEATLTPLLPISQTPPTPGPDGTSKGALHRPAMAAIPSSDEFLFASHTGSSCLGVFVNSRGEPSRSTLEWPSNPRSLTVSGGQVVALLANGTVEVHALETAEIVQVVSLATANPEGPIDARGVFGARSGVTVPGQKGAGKIRKVNVPLYPDFSDRPSTPPHALMSSTRRSVLSPTSILSSATSVDEDDDDRTTVHTLILGKDSVHALCPVSLVVQAEALMAANRWSDAVSLARQFRAPEPSPSPSSDELSDEAAYVFQRVAMHHLGNCAFSEALDLWTEGDGDARLVVKLLGNLRAGNVARRDEVEVYNGVEGYVRRLRDAEALVNANLVRNYSPHIKSIDTAASTQDLKASLLRTARGAVKTYLEGWRIRRAQTRREDDSLKVDMVVDTALAELYAESDPEALHTLLEGPNDCILAELEPSLVENGRYAVLVEVYKRRGETAKVVDALTKLLDGRWTDPHFEGSVEDVASLLMTADDPSLVSQHALWLVRHDPSIALRVLTRSTSAPQLDPRQTFEAILPVDEETAETYLQEVVLQRPSADPALQSDLVLRYLARLKTSLRPDQARTLASAYTESHAPDRKTFLKHLRRSLASASDADVQALKIRLKFILFLPSATSSLYADIRKDLEGMGGSDAAFAYERAIVYGKLGLHRPAISLLAVTLRDFVSAETYCLQGGDVLTKADMAETAALLGLKLPADATRRRARSSASSKSELFALLFDIGMASATPEKSTIMIGILSRHAPHLPLDRLLPSLPASWPLDATLSTYIIRSLRRTGHERDEATLVKAVALGQEMEWEVRLGDERVRKDKGWTQTEGTIGAKVSARTTSLVKKAEGEKEVPLVEVRMADRPPMEEDDDDEGVL